MRLGTHDGFVVISGRVKCTPEHPSLVRRYDQWGFVSAEFVQVGDALFLDGLGEETVATVERIAGRAPPEWGLDYVRHRGDLPQPCPACATSKSR